MSNYGNKDIEALCALRDCLNVLEASACIITVIDLASGVEKKRPALAIKMNDSCPDEGFGESIHPIYLDGQPVLEQIQNMLNSLA